MELNVQGSTEGISLKELSGGSAFTRVTESEEGNSLDQNNNALKWPRVILFQFTMIHYFILVLPIKTQNTTH